MKMTNLKIETLKIEFKLPRRGAESDEAKILNFKLQI
jgi:hypothetical protein